MKTLLKPFIAALALISALNAKAQVPLLNSFPSAQAVVYLDFNGHTVNGTSWNYNGPIYCGASGLDNTQVTTVFNRVAEDYRPFNVNITTDSTKFLAAPANKRMRVIATVTSDWYGSAGGVAFVGSFTWGDDTPCFIFTALLNYNVKNISEAVAHETGHTLGLYHQASYNASCQKTSDYNYGQGSGEIGWAPIMGVGYYQNLTLWYNGPNSFGCTNYQSDLDILTTTNGFGYRTDDYAATFAGAANTPFVGNRFTVNGIIAQNGDQDMIKFTQPSFGRFQLSAIPYNVGTGNAGSDLDMQVTLYNSAQTQLGVFNPGALLNSVADTQLNPGTYYLKIEGKGNMYAPNYASLGSYSLQGDFSTGSPLPLRRLELSGELVSDKHRLNWIIDADEAVIKQVLEISTDGRNFSPVTQSSNELRSFMYKPYVSATAQYRMNVTFDNGRQYYSNIVSLRATGKTDAPKLVSNLVSNTLTVSSPGNYSYTVHEFSGKTVAKGQLSNGLNMINTALVTGGMYIIRFSNGTGQTSEKFVKQ
ncbi:MAG TPA: zinc-dependent metalloprotease [Chitinophagaceae bacterium]|jgi:hypothetical protein|nr:zinc-dependent metalloprotease [Chitinophagaceae bacterium]